MVGFLIVAVIIGVWKLIRYNQPENKSIRRAFSATGTVWDDASSEERRRLLESAGVSKEKDDALVSTAWQSLNDYVKSPLVNLQLRAETNALSNNNHNLVSLDRKQSGSETISIQAANNSNSKSKPLSDPYLDAFCALVPRLSMSMLLPEWDTGVPESYNLREKESIDLTWSKLKYTVCPEVEEPLRSLLAEASLINLARELKSDLHDEFYDEWGGDWCKKIPSEDLGEIISTYLKSWLCAANPFVLLELADFMMQTGHPIEANEAVKVASMFPAHARNRTMNDLEVVALTLAHELLPFGTSRDARLGNSKGLYSTDAITLLNEKTRAFHESEGIHEDK